MAAAAPPAASHPNTNNSNGASVPSTKDAFNLALRARNPNNNYIAHLKIWETLAADSHQPDQPNQSDPAAAAAGLSRKARYLILAVQRDSGRVTINKAKRNANGSFSIGKDWDLNTLRQVIVHEPDYFTLTLSRAYSWQTERPREQQLFLQSLVKVYRKYTRDAQGPYLEGIQVPTAASTYQADAAPPPTTGIGGGSGDVGAVPHSQRQPSLSVNTAVAHEPSRASPSSRSPGGLAKVSASSAHDGFYDPRARESVATNATHSTATSIHQAAPSDAFYDPRARDGSAAAGTSMGTDSVEGSPRRPPVKRRPTLVSAAASDSSKPSTPTATGVPTISLPTGAGGANADDGGSASTPRDRSPLGSLGGGGGGNSAGRPAKDRDRSASSSALTNGTISTGAGLASKPAPSRKGSTESGSSLGVPSSGGDARARLSAIEPVRGGAAYEKMLLAGTGLSGVAEADDEEYDDEADEAAKAGADGGLLDPNDDRATTPLGAIERQTRAARVRNRRTRLVKSDAGGGNGNERTSGANGSAGAAGGAADASDTAAMDEEEEDETLLNIEELLETFEWRGGGSALGQGHTGAVAKGGAGLAAAAARAAASANGRRGTADVIEARLLDELAALDAANIHAIIESDDRVEWVVRHMEEALGQLDALDSMIAGFKVQLNSRADDIAHIESQNRGLQVQTSNQRTLQAEVERLLDTVHVDDAAVAALRHARLGDDQGIAEAELAAAALYRAMLQATRTDDERRAGAAAEMTMAAATERRQEYARLADDFARKLLEHLTRDFDRQKDAILHDAARNRSLQPPHPVLRDHAAVEDALGRYCGLLLYVKEVSPSLFARISAAYLSSASERYRGEMAKLFAALRSVMRASADEDAAAEASFATPSTTGVAAGVAGLRSGTIRRAAAAGFGGGLKAGAKGSLLRGGASVELSGSEAFARMLGAVTPLVWKEQSFVSDLLHVNDNRVTFADYMDLEPYFRRRAALLFGNGGGSAGGAANDVVGGAHRHAHAGVLRDMRSALDLIFGFLAPEWQAFAEQATARDKTQLVGVLAALDRALVEADEVQNEFLARSLAKLHARLAAQLERHVAEQVRTVEATRLSAKKRRGVVHFVRVLPIFVDRVEAQLVNAETLSIRSVVDGYYEQLSSAIFDALQAMAKLESSSLAGAAGGAAGGAGAAAVDDDKAQLNHHVILIENMHYLAREAALRSARRPNGTAGGVGVGAGVPALAPVVRRAEEVYEEHLNAYVGAVLRRPFGKLMDFCDGVDALLMRSTPAAEVSLHSAYSRSSFKRLVKEYGVGGAGSGKEVRKHVESLAKRVQKHFSLDDDAAAASAASAAAAASMMTAALQGGGGGADEGAGGAGMGTSSGSRGVGGGEDQAAEVMSRVWRACEHASVREMERLARVARECYSSSSSATATGGGGAAVQVDAASAVDEVRRAFANYVPMVKRR